MDTTTFAMGSMFVDPESGANNHNISTHDVNDYPSLDTFSDYDWQSRYETIDLSQDFDAFISTADVNNNVQADDTHFAGLTEAPPPVPDPCWSCSQFICDCDRNDRFAQTPMIQPLSVFPTAADDPPGLQWSDPSAVSISEALCATTDFVPDALKAPHESNRLDLPSIGASSIQHVPKTVRKRARLKDATRATLEKQFSFDVYPKDGEVSSLVKATNLTAKEIKT
jgi:hypothetical protein